MNIHLLLHTSLYMFDVLLLVSLALFVLIKAKRNTATTVLILLIFSTIAFILSHVIGVSVSDGDLSRKILMFNLIDILLPVLGAHCVLATLNKQKEQRVFIILLYAVGLGLVAFFIVNPRLFLVTSVPKLYFPNYYEPGSYYWLMLVFFFSVLSYLFYMMWRIYLASDVAEKNRIRYFFISLILGYLFGSVDFLLIYNIHIDPILGFLFVPLFAVPFTYAAVQYGLMDIRLVAKNAFVYVVTVSVLGAILIFLNYLNGLFVNSSPGFPSWIFSLILAVIASIAILLVWRKIRETDILKYEFINVVTHKFRTPLTSIKWSGENLVKEVQEPLQEDVRNIQTSTEHLVELTNLLVNLSSADDRSYEYRFSKIDLGDLLSDCVAVHAEAAAGKSITLVHTHKSGIVIAADTQRIRFVIQTLLDNAISYTPKGGTVTTDLSLVERAVVISVRDTGIGISRNDIKHLFTKFYRADNGRKTDTEGMGIGLYLSKRIVEKHGGKIWVESEGEGKGSIFYVSLPMGK